MAELKQRTVDRLSRGVVASICLDSGLQKPGMTCRLLVREEHLEPRADLPQTFVSGTSTRSLFGKWLKGSTEECNNMRPW